MRKILMLVLCLLLIGCQKQVDNSTIANPESKSPTIEEIMLPDASGILVFSNDLIELDYSNTNQGYIMVKTLRDDHKKLKVQIIKDEVKYNYDLNLDYEYEVFPLNMLDGDYIIKVFESIDDSRFALIASVEVNVELENERISFLYPSQIVNYSNNTEAVKKSFEIVNGIKTEIDREATVYEYITNNIGYDWNKVEEVKSQYVLPVVDDTLKTQKGICFDYAALMSTMLRVQQIPTKVVTGYVDEGYHAWVEVYIDNVGWITPHIYFEKEQWQLLDPTFEAMNSDYNGKYEKKYEY